MLSRAAVSVAVHVLVWIQVAAHFTLTRASASVPCASSWARPDKMIVVAAKPPYYSWKECASPTARASFHGNSLAAAHAFGCLGAPWVRLGWVLFAFKEDACGFFQVCLCLLRLVVLPDVYPPNVGNHLSNDGKRYSTHFANETKHAGAVTLL